MPSPHENFEVFDCANEKAFQLESGKQIQDRYRIGWPNDVAENIIHVRQTMLVHVRLYCGLHFLTFQVNLLLTFLLIFEISFLSQVIIFVGSTYDNCSLWMS